MCIHHILGPLIEGKFLTLYTKGKQPSEASVIESKLREEPWRKVDFCRKNGFFLMCITVDNVPIY